MSSVPESSQRLYFTEHGSGPPLLASRARVDGHRRNVRPGDRSSRHQASGDRSRPARPRPQPATSAAVHGWAARSRPHATAGPSGHRLRRRARLLPGRCIAQQQVLDHPSRCHRLILFCTYAFNMATPREKLEGHLPPVLVHLLGMQRMAKLVVSQGTKQLGNERATWLG